MMTSSNGNIFRVTGPLWVNSPVTGEFPAKPVTRSFDGFFDLHLNKRLSKNNGDAGDLRRNHAHYGVIVMEWIFHQKDICGRY